MNKKQKKETLNWKIRKHYRWLRLYMRWVRMVEREIGGCIEAL